MILTDARVTHFRCVDDSGRFSVGPLTCLVGKNESGKTTVLQGLYRLNPWHPGDGGFDRLDDYPRARLLDYEVRHAGTEAKAVETGWELEADDVEAIEQALGRRVLVSRGVRVSRDYADAIEVKVAVDETRAIAHLAEAAGVDASRARELGLYGSTARLAAHLAENPDDLGAAGERLRRAIEALPRSSATRAAEAIISERLPRFLYFGSFDRLPGKIALDTVRRQRDEGTLGAGERMVLGLLEITGVTLEQALGADRHEALVARLEAASARLSEELAEYWSQDPHLRVQFRIEPGRPGDTPPFDSGMVMRTRILNALHGMSIDFDTRSSGFVWFYSFLVLFSRLRRDNVPVVLLLDEPGLSLHARGQRDLLAFIRERLRPNHQVIYTTHSPFMLPMDDIRSIRTVEDVVVTDADGSRRSEGTRVGDEYLSRDPDTVFPLRTALAYEVTRPLMGPGHILLVDAPSTMVILDAFSRMLKRLGHAHLDPRWKPTPVGSLAQLAAFLNLTGQGEGTVAVLLGAQAARSREFDEIQRSWLLNQAGVLSPRRYTGRSNADVEDIIGMNAYVRIVNRALGLGIEPPPTDEDAPSALSWARHVTQQQGGTFDRMDIALHIAAHMESLVEAVPALRGALGRFESLFRDINAMADDREPA